MKKVPYMEYQRALQEMQYKFKDHGIYFYNEVTLHPTNEIHIGVNWAAMGTVSPADTIEYAKLLARAAHAADGFIYNGYEVEYGD